MDAVTYRNNLITQKIKVLTTLCYLATGWLQLCSANKLDIVQPAVSRTLHITINALSRPHIDLFVYEMHMLEADNSLNIYLFN